LYMCLWFVGCTAPRDQGYEKALAAFELSLRALHRSQLDLYLIHWPGTQGLKRDDCQNTIFRRESWRALEELHRSGGGKFNCMVGWMWEWRSQMCREIKLKMNLQT